MAVKIIMKEHVDADFDKRFIEGECKALHRSKGHPNVVGCPVVINGFISSNVA